MIVGSIAARLDFASKSCKTEPGAQRMLRSAAEHRRAVIPSMEKEKEVYRVLRGQEDEIHRDRVLNSRSVHPTDPLHGAAPASCQESAF